MNNDIHRLPKPNLTASQVRFEQSISELAKKRFWRHPDCAAEIIAKHYCQNALVGLQLAQVLQKRREFPDVDCDFIIHTLVETLSQNHLQDFGSPFCEEMFTERPTP